MTSRTPPAGWPASATTTGPKIFHNLRATRQTELEEENPSHVVCAWLGNSEIVARKHYLQVTDAHFANAAQIPAQQPPADGGNASQAKAGQAKNPSGSPRGSKHCEPARKHRMTLTGIEPVSRP